MIRRRTTRSDVRLNLTSMLDVIFLLIVFFILVNNFTTAHNVPMEPPDPEDSQAVRPEERDRVVVNMVPERSAGGGVRLRVGIRDLPSGDLDRLTAVLNQEREKRRRRESDTNLQVDLRADRSLDYSRVRPVIRAIAAAGVTRINLVALLEEER